MPPFVILSVGEESCPFRADSHSRHPSLRGRETPAAIRFLCTSHLLQICGFAGLFIVLSIISGTPLSSLVGRKLQRSTRRRGEKNLPALRSTPLRAESFLFRWSPAARRRRSARAPTEMFRAGNKGSVSDEEPRYAVPAMFLWLPCAKGAVARRRLKD